MVGKFRKIIGKGLAMVLALSVMSTLSNPAHARILFKGEFLIEDNGSDAFIIDSGDDVSGNITLQFGSSLGEGITFDTVNGWFEITDDLNFDQYEIKNAVIENLASAPATPIPGQIYYDTNNNNTYIWDGSGWEDITAAGGGGSADMDDVYDNDLDKILNVDHANGLEFNSTISSDIIFDMQSTGDVAFQNAGTTYAEFTNTGEFYVDNLQLDANTLSSIDVNGNINLDPNGTGRVIADSDLDINGLNFTLDADNVGTGNIVNIVANQGVSPDGILRYHAPSDTWEVSTDGGVTWDDLDDNTLDEAYDEGGAGAGRVITADSGFVEINGDGLRVDNIQTNDNTISAVNLNGSITLDPAGSGIVTAKSNVDMEGTDLELDSDNAGSGANVNIIANQGSDLDGILRYNASSNEWEVSSDGGSTWDDLNDNTLDQAYDEGGAGAGRIITANNGTVEINGDGLDVDNIQINDNSITSTNTNGNVTIDPDGNGFVNLGADVNVDGETVVLDFDNTGGNITIQFGQTLSESIFWDSGNSRFTLTDDARIEGNAAVIGQAFIADNHTATDSDGTINLGRSDSAWETFVWDNVADQFEISDDLNVSGFVGIGTTSPNFDLHLFNTSSTTNYEWLALDNGTDVATILTGTQDPTLVATDADTGSIFMNTATGRVYTKSDDGSTTNWLPSGLDQGTYAALTGTFGTPGITNKFVTDEDPRLGATGGAFGEVSLGTRLDYDELFAINPSLIYYVRIFLPSDTTMNDLGVYTTSSKNGDINLGLYSDDGTGEAPDSLLATTGTQTSSSPVDDFWEFPLSTPYDVTTAGFYWLSLVTSTNPVATSYKQANDNFIPYRIESTTNPSTTLPGTASPAAKPNTANLPFIAGFE